MTTDTAIDVLTLARALIRCPSVTPEDAGALDHLQHVLEGLGFACHRLRFSETGTADVDNLYARFGRGRPNFCFAGHTDVVPVGDRAAWSVDPFEAAVVDGMLYGRGATDMKGAIACFVAAADRFLRAHGGDFGGSISLLITGDEEGPAINGTRKVLDWMTANGEAIDHCLVGEPTNPQTLGEMVKIGRRGTLSGRITVSGTQGHVAYPDLADNPIPRLIAMLSRLLARRLDDGDSHFQPSNLEITTIDVGNPASNVIPAQAMAQFNIRFNPAHSGDGLSAWIREQCEAIGGAYRLDLQVGGEPFLTPPGTFSTLIGRAIQDATRTVPKFSTTGGTSDARFIRALCPVAEFGLISQSMHKVDERVSVDDLRVLVEVYERILRHYFA